MAGSGRYPSKTGFKKKTKKSRKNTKKTRTSPEKHQKKRHSSVSLEKKPIWVSLENIDAFLN